MLTDGLLFELELFCEPVSGCGVTIVGSRSSGIAIKSLLPGGIADQVSKGQTFLFFSSDASTLIAQQK